MLYQVTNYIDDLPKKTAVFKKISDSILLPRLIKFNRNLYALSFHTMKLLPAKHIIHEAIKRNEIEQNCTIVDTSSGTFALGIGIICAELELPFRIFGDPAIDDDLIRRLNDLGGKVHISKNPKSPGAYQALRLEALNQFITVNKLSFWARQYDNLDNTRSYSIVGEHLVEALGANLNIVGPVGSGGSTAGIISTIRSVNQSAKLIGVDTFNSVLFGQNDGPRTLRGLGNSIFPKNLVHTCYDEIHWVNANDAFFYTRKLFKEKAFFSGPTSGASFKVANYLAKKNPDEMYVFISPDDGSRYLSTVYHDTWLKQQIFHSDNICELPRKVEHPLDATEPWCYFDWDRRSYFSVMEKNFD